MKAALLTVLVFVCVVSGQWDKINPRLGYADILGVATDHYNNQVMLVDSDQYNDYSSVVLFRSNTSSQWISTKLAVPVGVGVEYVNGVFMVFGYLTPWYYSSDGMNFQKTNLFSQIDTWVFSVNNVIAYMVASDGVNPNQVARSTDGGIVWELVSTMPLLQDKYASISTKGNYFMVTDMFAIYLSSDGYNWISWPGTYDFPLAIRYAPRVYAGNPSINELLVIDDDNQYTVYSTTDLGKTWQNRGRSTKLGITSNGWAFFQGTYAALSYADETQTLYVSPDAVNWKPIDVPFTFNKYFFSELMVVGNELWVTFAIGYATTTDLKAWTIPYAGVTSMNTSSFNNIYALSSGSFVIDCYDASSSKPALFVATDGSSTAILTPPFTKFTRKWSSGNTYTYMVLNEDDVMQLYSTTDFVAWNNDTILPYAFRYLVQGNGGWVGAHHASDRTKALLYYTTSLSANASQWQLVFESEAVDYAYYSLTFGNGMFALLFNNSIVYTSTDGKTWTQTATIDTEDNSYVTYVGSLFFVARSPINYYDVPPYMTTAYTSTDGKTWTYAPIPVQLATPSSLKYVEQFKRYLAFGPSSRVGDNKQTLMSSIDGKTWTNLEQQWGFDYDQVILQDLALNGTHVVLIDSGYGIYVGNQTVAK